MIATAAPKIDNALVCTPTQFALALETCIRIKAPAFGWGNPGIGKSDIVRQVADRLFAADYGMSVDANGRLHDAQGRFTDDRPWLRDIRAGLLDPVDLRGLPNVQNGQTVWAPPAFLPTAGTGVLFLDELNRAPMSVQNALLQLALDRKLGEYTLPEGWAVVAAGNYESDGGGVQRMSAALAMRFKHLHVEPDLPDFCKWAYQNGIYAMVPAYLRWTQTVKKNPDGTDRPNSFHNFDPRAKASPSPRSWKFVSDIMQANPDPSVQLQLIAGTVGQYEAYGFLSFDRMFKDLPDPDLVILNPDTAQVPTEVSAQYAMSAALAAMATTNNVGKIIRYLDRLPVEFSVFAVKDMTARDESLSRTPEFGQWIVKHQDVLN